MTVESDFSSEFCRLTKPLHPWRVENLLFTGTPDVNLTVGWVELKALKGWPKRKNTPVRLPHFTQEQRYWLHARWLACRGVTSAQGAWMALRVRREWFLFPANDSIFEIGNLTAEELRCLAQPYFPQKPSSAELCAALSK